MIIENILLYRIDFSRDHVTLLRKEIQQKYFAWQWLFVIQNGGTAISCFFCNLHREVAVYRVTPPLFHFLVYYIEATAIKKVTL